MKRRRDQEREEADAHEQAEARREALLAELRAREAASRAPEPEAIVEAEEEEAEEAAAIPDPAEPEQDEPAADE